MKLAPGPKVYQGKYDPPAGSPTVVKETGAFPTELEKKYNNLKVTLDVFSQAIVSFVNAYDRGNSRKTTPSWQDTVQMATNLFSEFGKVSKFLADLESFKAEYAKVKNVITKRFVA
jgi:hypothetical protein